MAKSKIFLRTPRTSVRLAESKDVPLVLDYFKENKLHLQKTSPVMANNAFFTESFWKENIEASLEKYEADEEYRFFVFSPAEDEILGSVSLTNVCRGAFQACNLGYGIAQKHEGHGLMFESLAALLPEAFRVLNLHRIMANYMPQNLRSGRVLQRLGFEKEGVAKDYLWLNGAWEDHVLTSKLNPEWIPAHKN